MVRCGCGAGHLGLGVAGVWGCLWSEIAGVKGIWHWEWLGSRVSGVKGDQVLGYLAEERDRT